MRENEASVYWIKRISTALLYKNLRQPPSSSRRSPKSYDNRAAVTLDLMRGEIGVHFVYIG